MALPGLYRRSSIPAPEAFEALLRGEFTALVDETVEEEHPVRGMALSTVTAVRLALFRDGSGPVVVDTRYRLYTREEFEHHEGDDTILEERIAWIRAVADRIRKKGIALVVLPVPSKARVLDAETRLYAGLEDHPRWNRLRDGLRSAGVVVADPLPALTMTENAFLLTDTHWSREGARAAAATVAETYRKELAPVLPAGAEFELELGDPEEHRGDLLRFVPLGPLEVLFPLAGDTIRVPEVRQIRGAASGLFDTPDIPVALVGTSFSAGERWNFAGALQYELQADVLNVSEEGLGPFVPMDRYLTGETFREIVPSLIVWEIPERYLTLPGIDLP